MSQPPLIVCIDDEPGNIKLVTYILQKQNMRVEGATNGRDGLALIGELLPDLVLLDIMMPGMDGWEVYNHLRSNERTQNIPVVILTARSSEFEEMLALSRAGVDDYLTKPFLPHELQSRINKLLGL